MTNDLYPLRFEPQFFEKPWGGKNLKTYPAFDIADMKNCGEVWLLSGVEGKQSVVTNGFLAGNEINELVEVYMDDLVGEKVYTEYGDVFPLLIKILDTTEWLSVQAHPDNELAMKKHSVPFGKTEMWYVLHAGENASILNGFKRQTDASQVAKAIQSGTIAEMLNNITPVADDVFFTPAGKIHAIGPGVTAAEIQQTSDYTYRLYDWGRTDAEGNPRELHLANGLEALDYDDTGTGRMTPVVSGQFTETLVSCPQFVTNRIRLLAEIPLGRNYLPLDSFIILMCTQGQVVCTFSEGSEKLQRGECLLVPAMLDEMNFISSEGAELLEIYIQM